MYRTKTKWAEHLVKKPKLQCAIIGETEQKCTCYVHLTSCSNRETCHVLLLPLTSRGNVSTNNHFCSETDSLSMYILVIKLRFRCDKITLVRKTKHSLWWRHGLHLMDTNPKYFCGHLVLPPDLMMEIFNPDKLVFGFTDRTAVLIWSLGLHVILNPAMFAKMLRTQTSALSYTGFLYCLWVLFGKMVCVCAGFWWLVSCDVYTSVD